MQFGKLEKVDLRKGWNHEAYDFTQWLAQPENIQILSDEIGIDIDVIETESRVGDFFVDIYAQDNFTQETIIIENQLEKTNHDHLGKIITYASGLDAKTMIWIFKEIKAEHRQAMDWLNEITDDTMSFFAIKLELWKIDDSKYAPKFNIICSPNHWSKTVRQSKNEKEFTETEMFNFSFWENYTDYIENNSKILKSRKASPQSWYSFRVGTSQAAIHNIISIMYSEFRVELYINDNKDMYDFLYEDKESIEKEIGYSLLWERLDDKKASRISIKKRVDDVKENENLHYQWLLDQTELFYKVFSKRLINM
jgi:hypothetical protein